jgi:hypothetical protein
LNENVLVLQTGLCTTDMFSLKLQLLILLILCFVLAFLPYFTLFDEFLQNNTLQKAQEDNEKRLLKREIINLQSKLKDLNSRISGPSAASNEIDNQVFLFACPEVKNSSIGNQSLQNSNYLAYPQWAEGGYSDKRTVLQVNLIPFVLHQYFIFRETV